MAAMRRNLTPRKITQVLGNEDSDDHLSADELYDSSEGEEYIPSPDSDSGDCDTDEEVRNVTAGTKRLRVSFSPDSSSEHNFPGFPSPQPSTSSVSSRSLHPAPRNESCHLITHKEPTLRGKNRHLWNVAPTQRLKGLKEP